MQGDSEKHQGSIESLLSLELLAGPLCNPLCRQAVDLVSGQSLAAGVRAKNVDKTRG